MAGYRCPFCGEIMSIHRETHYPLKAIFWDRGSHIPDTNPHILLDMYKCPNNECRKISVYASGINGFIGNSKVAVYPQAIYEHYPDYIPIAIRNDYEEACKILDLSPKASATLSRRCLQGMIHDFWNIHEKNLNAEITQLRGNVPPAQWSAIDAVRSVGNIGAHMEHDVNLIVDIERDEAQKLIRLIEHLMKTWYIDRHESEKLFADLTQLSVEKAAARKA